jgi:hypothetical protein
VDPETARQYRDAYDRFLEWQKVDETEFQQHVHIIHQLRQAWRNQNVPS